MSKLSPSTKEPLDKDGFCPCEFTDVRQGIQEAADSGTTLGVSLKKVDSTASVQEFNTPKRTHNKRVNYLGFTFGQTGDFFNSIDIYLYFSTGKMQLRATNVIKSWQGEIKGQFAAGGKIGGGNLNYYTEKNMKKSIGEKGKISKAKADKKYSEKNKEKLLKKKKEYYLKNKDKWTTEHYKELAKKRKQEKSLYTVVYSYGQLTLPVCQSRKYQDCVDYIDKQPKETKVYNEEESQQELKKCLSEMYKKKINQE